MASPKIPLSSRFKVGVVQILMVTSTTVLQIYSIFRFSHLMVLSLFYPGCQHRPGRESLSMVFSLPLSLHLSVYTHTHTALCGAQFTEGLWQGQKQFISPQHKNLTLIQMSYSKLSQDTLPHHSYLLGFLVTIMFSSDLKISFLHPLLFYLLLNHQFRVLVFFFKHVSKVLP